MRCSFSALFNYNLIHYNGSGKIDSWRIKMPQTLSASEKPLYKVFSEDYVFRIPNYQRPYSWTVEQARELFEDLLGFIQANPGALSDMPPYFLGSIVLIKTDKPDADVVDGQQRLTTLTILLSAIRAKTTGSNSRMITRRIYEEGDPLVGNAERFRLTLRDRDSEFFRKYVQREGGIDDLVKIETKLTDSEQNLRSNAKLFLELLDGLTAEQRIELAQFILQRCYLVVVSTPDEDSAYRIFSVLNSRGLNLSATDILKAKIISGIGPTDRESYARKWEDIEEELGRENFEALFGHIRSISRKAKAQETLLKEFQLYVGEIKTPKVLVDEMLMPMSQIFGDICRADYPLVGGSAEINEHLRFLNYLAFSDWIPPTLAFVIRNRNDAKAIKSFFGSLERVAYFLLATNKSTTERIERFSKITSEIERNVDLSVDSSALQLTPPEQLEFFECLNGNFYEGLSSKAVKPILLRLDSLLSDGGARYDYPIISVEHVLPQNPKDQSEWLTWFPEPSVRLEFVHRIGNLALLTRRKNSQASNWDFRKKKETYFKRDGVVSFVLTSQIVSEPKWDLEIVKRRQSELMTAFADHWRLNDRMSRAEWIIRNL